MNTLRQVLFGLSFLSIYNLVAQPSSFESRGIGGGGALFSPVINPANDQEIYMACDMSEIFHSSNRGQSWQMLPFVNIQGGHDSKMQFTINPKIRYCIDYTSKDGTDLTRPMKSIDGGKTWKQLPGNPLPNEVAYNLTADRKDSNRLILGFYGEIYFSKDGGTSFSKIYTCKSNGEGNHIAGVFFQGNNIYIGLNDGLLKSTDGGGSFLLMTTTGIPSGEKMLSFSAGEDGSGLRFVCLTLTNVWAGIQHAFEYTGGSGASMQGVYVMDNADGNWKSKSSGINKATDYPVFTGMAESNSSIMYVSGGSSSGAPIVMKSTDGGNSWKHAFLSNNNQNIYTGWSGHSGDRAWSYGECPFGFHVMMNNPNKLIFTDFGFAHLSYDGGTNWQQLYVDFNTQNNKGVATPKGKLYKGVGLENTTNWNILWLDSNQVFSSFSDINGIMSLDKGKSWKFIPNLTQNSVYHMVKDLNGNIYAATSTVHDIYQSTRLTDAYIDAGKGGVWFSNNKGVSFSLLHDFGHPVIWLALDPKNPKRMYASVLHSTQGGIFVSNDIDKGAASSWVKLSNPPRTEGHPFVIRVLTSGHLVATYSARRAGSPQQFTASSGIYYSTNGGTSWMDKSATAMKYWTKDVVIDPTDPTENTWYVSVFSGWGSAVPPGTGGLYRSINRGDTWNKISDATASYRVNSCAVNPENKDEMFYTTETDGLWYTNNLSSSAPVFTLVKSYPFRHPVRVTYNPYKASEIWISAFGAGMMTANLKTGTVKKPDVHNSKAVVYPNPAQDYLYCNVSNALSFSVYSQTGQLMFTKSEKAEDSILKVDMRALHSGLYFIVINHSGAHSYHKFIKN